MALQRCLRDAPSPFLAAGSSLEQDGAVCRELGAVLGLLRGISQHLEALGALCSSFECSGAAWVSLQHCGAVSNTGVAQRGFAHWSPLGQLFGPSLPLPGPFLPPTASPQGAGKPPRAAGKKGRGQEW